MSEHLEVQLNRLLTTIECDGDKEDIKYFAQKIRNILAEQK